MASPLTHFGLHGSRIRWSLRYRGMAMTLLSCLANLLSLTKCDWYWKYKERKFDRRHGIDTGGIIPVQQLDVSADEQEGGWGYMPTQPEWFHTALSQLDIPLDQFTFVDFGSGKGRSMLIAAALPFRQIVGVEFSAQLHRIASSNIRIWSETHPSCPSMTAILSDATSYRLPPDPLLLYFYNPFKEPVMRQVLSNIEASFRDAPRPIFVVYAGPTCAELLDASPLLERVASFSSDPELLVYEARP